MRNLPLNLPNEGFYNELVSLINKYSKESESNTPDCILATYLEQCLLAFNFAIKMRDLYAQPSAYPYKQSPIPNTYDPLSPDSTSLKKD